MPSITERTSPPKCPALFGHTVILKDDGHLTSPLQDWASRRWQGAIHLLRTEVDASRNLRKWVKLGKDLICRVAHLHGLELENLPLMVLLCVPKKRDLDFYMNGGWIPWLLYKPGQECSP